MSYSFPHRHHMYDARILLHACIILHSSHKCLSLALTHALMHSLSLSLAVFLFRSFLSLSLSLTLLCTGCNNNSCKRSVTKLTNNINKLFNRQLSTLQSLIQLHNFLFCWSKINDNYFNGGYVTHTNEAYLLLVYSIQWTLTLIMVIVHMKYIATNGCSHYCKSIVPFLFLSRHSCLSNLPTVLYSLTQKIKVANSRWSYIHTFLH